MVVTRLVVFRIVLSTASMVVVFLRRRSVGCVLHVVERRLPVAMYHSGLPRTTSNPEEQELVYKGEERRMRMLLLQFVAETAG